MLLAKQVEAGHALLAEDDKWLLLSDYEDEDLSANVFFMARLAKNKAFETESTDDDEYPNDEVNLNSTFSLVRDKESLNLALSNLTTHIKSLANKNKNLQNSISLSKSEFSKLLEEHSKLLFEHDAIKQDFKSYKYQVLVKECELNASPDSKLLHKCYNLEKTIHDLSLIHI